MPTTSSIGSPKNPAPGELCDMQDKEYNMNFPFLPNITIRTDVEPRLFLNRLEKIVADHPSFIIKTQKRISHESQICSLYLKLNEPGLPEGLNTVLVFNKQDDYRVLVEASAEGWAINSPGYGEYVNAVRQVISPLLKVYNKVYKTNRRLTIQTKEQLRPKLSMYPAQLFQHFLYYANRTFLGRRSWRDFYSFIITCHGRNEFLSSEELVFLLNEAGFNEYYCDKLSTIFEHGWDLLEQLPESRLKAWRRRMREQEKMERGIKPANKSSNK